MYAGEKFDWTFLKITDVRSSPMGGSFVKLEDAFQHHYSPREGEVVKARYVATSDNGNIVVDYHDGYGVLNWLGLVESNFFAYLVSAFKRRVRRFKNRNVLMPISEV
jgi:hypothetical protein